MRVLVLVPYLYDTAPGQRFRFEQWEPWLRQHGVRMTFVPFENPQLHNRLHQPGQPGRKVRLILQALARRTRLLNSLHEYDAVLVHREASLVGPPFLERRIQQAGLPMLFDFDDAIFIPATSAANKYMGWLKFHSKTRDICQMVDHVIAGNEYLADFAREVNGHVSVIPTTIDTEKYTVSPQRDFEATNRILTIGWSGSFSTVQYFDTLRTALQRLHREEPFRLRVIGTPQYELEGIEVEAMRWRSESEVDDLQSIDIGVMPLPDDQWTKGKCGLKALQYMALGIPTIISPVGVNSDIIKDGKNGFLATTEDEWVDKLRQLLRSAELRRELGLAGRATVEGEYSATAQAPRVLEILQTVVANSAAQRETTANAA
jgi:glycosyltransferase involved in cell wall biosynthesis